MLNPHDIEGSDISNVVIDTVLGVSNMRYFKSQEIGISFSKSNHQ